MAINQNLDDVLGSGYEAKVPDLDWAKLKPENYDNIPTENKVEAIPQLVEAWSNRPERGTRLVGYVDAAAVRKTSKEASERAVEDIVSCAKREMMKGLKGRALAEKLASLYPPEIIKAAQDQLRTLSDEQGLLGNVYVDVSVYDSCREAAQLLGTNRIRLAEYVVGTPRKRACATHGEGYCSELKKAAVKEVPYGADLFDRYTRHLRVAGVIDATESVTDKNTLRDALVRTPKAKSHTTSVEVHKESSVKKSGAETLDMALEKAASEREAAEARYAAARPVLCKMQNMMLQGMVGDDLRRSLASSLPETTIREHKAEISRVASLQGLLGTVYVDVGYYKNAADASAAISSAKMKPSYIINSSPSAAWDGRIAAVSKATGCQLLPEDGRVDKKIAHTYIEDLRYSGRISSSMAQKFSNQIDAGMSPLGVLREAFLCRDREDKSTKSAAQIGTWFTGSVRKSDDRSSLREAALKALENGLPSDKICEKMAGIVTTAEATGIIHSLLSEMREISASCLPNCDTETYPIQRGCRIKMADKCSSCINSTGSACLRQGVKFAGAVDYDKAFVDMSALLDESHKSAEKEAFLKSTKNKGCDLPDAGRVNSVCPKCGKNVWDTATPDQKLNKCWNCGLRFDVAERSASDKSKRDGKSVKVKYDPKDDVDPSIRKVLLDDNPDAAREDMKQKYDMSDEFGSGGNKVLERLRAEDGGSKSDENGGRKDKRSK